MFSVYSTQWLEKVVASTLVCKLIMLTLYTHCTIAETRSWGAVKQLALAVVALALQPVAQQCKRLTLQQQQVRYYIVTSFLNSAL
jgi:hypothetical protein